MRTRTPHLPFTPNFAFGRLTPFGGILILSDEILDFPPFFGRFN